MYILKNAGIDFDKFLKYGIEPKQFAEYFMGSGLLLNDDIHWIVFHGGFDIGYLLRLTDFLPLPQTDIDFQQKIRTYFPNLWDIKYILHELFPKKTYSLARIVNEMGVQRIG